MLRRLSEELSESARIYIGRGKYVKVTEDSATKSRLLLALENPPIALLRVNDGSPCGEVKWTYWAIGRKEDIEVFEEELRTRYSR